MCGGGGRKRFAYTFPAKRNLHQEIKGNVAAGAFKASALLGSKISMRSKTLLKQIGGPNMEPKNDIILCVGTPKMVPLISGNSYLGSPGIVWV